MATPSRDQLEATVQAKAASDSDFRSKLLSDPKGVISSELGGADLGSVDIKVVEEEAGVIYIVLPSASSDLSEADLEAIAGGKGGTNSWRCAPFTEAGCK